MKFPRLMPFVPSWKSAALAWISAVMLILSFPDFEFWFLAWLALVPLFMAVEREKESSVRSFLLGWLWGFIFFTGTCWWLTFAPINYAGFPPIIAYSLLLCVTGIVAIFPGLFAAIESRLSARFGNIAILAAPFVWVFSEFLRYWMTGNNWNAIGYSQFVNETLLSYAPVGGVLLTSFVVASLNVLLGIILYAVGRWYGTGTRQFFNKILAIQKNEEPKFIGNPESQGAWWSRWIILGWIALLLIGLAWSLFEAPRNLDKSIPVSQTTVVAIQPNVPMSGLTYEKWKLLRAKHVDLAESALAQIKRNPQSAIPNPRSTTVFFPESPMNFAYEEDVEFRTFLRGFAARNNVNVLFNSAEPDGPNNKYFNSAVLVGTDGKEIAQYDKIYLLPFGESVPAPLQAIVPAFVGSFSYGKEYDLLPIGDVKAGVMICFESHFGELGREYVRDGADMLIEMTNDGYLGPTPVLRQHLANAVFRAAETNRPVLRVTNVGITAYVSERGEVMNPTQGYTEDTRIWSVSKSDGRQTFYVTYGDWFAWFCSIVTLVLLALTIRLKKAVRFRQ